jgi:hypothetical protein
MPCVSGYLEPNARECESMLVQSFLKEVGLRKTQPGEYGNPATLDADTERLCDWCTLHDVSERSLELQIWWRDHQRADVERKKREAAEARERALVASALSKLTDAEIRALRVEQK